MQESEKLSLYRIISEKGYEASVIGTYAISFPLYERVVLRRMQAAGCRHNILLVDGGECAKQLETSDGPQFCGSDYLLLPIRSAGAFHPKFVLLLGKRGARLVLGSHNVTVAGFGLNRETGTSFSCDPNGPDAAAARQVWRFVRAWTGEFPARIKELIAATENIAPWLTGDAGDSIPAIRWSEPDGEALWPQVRSLLGSRVNRVTVLSPYFDAKLAFIKLIEKELQPKECVVAVHPKFTELPPNARALSPKTRFVDVSGLAEDWVDRYVHAKLYRFEASNGKSMVVVGSANASAPAWLIHGPTRNAELVVVHQDGEQLWKRLGLSGVGAAPPVGNDGWAEIKERAETRVHERPSASPFVAYATSRGFVVDELFVRGAKAWQIHVIVNEVPVATVDAVERDKEGMLCVCNAPVLRNTATRLEVRLAAGRRIALIHQISDLLDKAAGSSRQAFRRAFSGLEGDPEQLSELIRVVERAIFDEGIPLDGTRASRIKNEKSLKPKELGTLAISATETTKARRKRRLSASSDLAVIIDTLIYRLGQGLGPKLDADVPVSVTTSEESLRDEDAEPSEFDGHTLAKTCRSKVNRLFRRMGDQCAAAVARADGATTPIVQLAAVLGIVKHLRTRQATFLWLPKGEQLVDADKKWDFFAEMSRYLYSSTSGLAARALAEQLETEFDELTSVRGLLAWLALDCELDTRHVRDEEPEVTRDNVSAIGYFLPVIADCARDDYAGALLRDVAAEEKQDLQAAASYHLTWASKIVSAFDKRQVSEGPITMGDVVFPTKMNALFPSIVIDAQYGKAGILNLDTGEAKYFATGFLGRIQGLQG